MSRAELEKIEKHRAFSFGGKLFCHQRLPARDSFPINVTLGFSGHVVADPRKIVAMPDALLNPVVGELRVVRWQLRISRWLGIDEVGLIGHKSLRRTHKPERVTTR